MLGLISFQHNFESLPVMRCCDEPSKAANKLFAGGCPAFNQFIGQREDFWLRLTENETLIASHLSNLHKRNLCEMMLQRSWSPFLTSRSCTITSRWHVQPYPNHPNALEDQHSLVAQAQ